MDKTIKLRKCPFCGGEANLYKITFFYKPAYKVYCSQCDVSTPYAEAGMMYYMYPKKRTVFISHKEAIQKAIDRWNNPNTRK